MLKIYEKAPAGEVHRKIMCTKEDTGHLSTPIIQVLYAIDITEHR